MLAVLIENSKLIDVSNFLLIIYVDEEYQFAGMKSVTNYLSGLNPKLIVSLDGEKQIQTSCRGCIEINLEITGKTAHSGNPQNGINAISESIKCINRLEKEIQKFDKIDAKNTLNIASIIGGFQSNAEIDLSIGNLIPDIVRIKLEIRPADKRITAQLVLQKLKSELIQSQLTLNKYEILIDLGPLQTNSSNYIAKYLPAIVRDTSYQSRIINENYSGYIDIQMLANKFPSPVMIIGLEGGDDHAANEWIIAKSINELAKIYLRLLLLINYE